MSSRFWKHTHKIHFQILTSTTISLTCKSWFCLVLTQTSWLKHITWLFSTNGNTTKKNLLSFIAFLQNGPKATRDDSQRAHTGVCTSIYRSRHDAFTYSYHAEESLLIQALRLYWNKILARTAYVDREKRNFLSELRISINVYVYTYAHIYTYLRTYIYYTHNHTSVHRRTFDVPEFYFSTHFANFL